MARRSDGQLQIVGLEGNENTNGKRGLLHAAGKELHDLLYPGFGSRGTHYVRASASGIDETGRTWAVTARVRTDAVGIVVHGSFGTTTRELEIWPQRTFLPKSEIERLHTALNAVRPRLDRELCGAIEKHRQRTQSNRETSLA